MRLPTEGMQVGRVKGQKGPCQTPSFKGWPEGDRSKKKKKEEGKEEEEEEEGMKDSLEKYMENEDIAML